MKHPPPLRTRPPKEVPLPLEIERWQRWGIPPPRMDRQPQWMYAIAREV